MATTIELFGITAEVPEGHPDFRVDSLRRPEFRTFLSDTRQFLWARIDSEFFSDTEDGYLYWQRRVVEAAFKHFGDKSDALCDISADITQCLIAAQQAENWREIGKKAKEGAGK